MNDSQLVYKVCLSIPNWNKKFNEPLNRLVSINNSARLEYKVGEKTVPDFGKLFVYSNLEDAKRCRESWSYLDAVILEGLADGTIETTISGNRSGDDRVLYLNVPTPTNNENPSCD